MPREVEGPAHDHGTGQQPHKDVRTWNRGPCLWCSLRFHVHGGLSTLRSAHHPLSCGLVPVISTLNLGLLSKLVLLSML